MGVPGLERLESGATQPFVKGGAKALAGEATAFGRVYLGLGVKTVPPQGVLRLVVDAKDAARGAEKIRAWEQTVNASRDRWKESMPSVAKLYDSIRVQTAGARSTIEFTVDRTLAANSQRVIDEVLAAAFGGLGIRVEPAERGGAGRADRHRAGRVPPRGDPGRAARLRSAGPVRRGGGPDPGPVRGEARRAAPGRGAAGGIARRIARGGPGDRWSRASPTRYRTCAARARTACASSSTA